MQTEYEVPILLLLFNRPNHTKRVFEVVKKIKPKYLYLFQDGPRFDNENDIIKCKEVNNIFDEELDWECNISKYQSDTNLGCGFGPATGITWFFENVEEGIIFEDDCLPSLSIFEFYKQLLLKYRNDTTVSVITGTNPLLNWFPRQGSYFYATIGTSPMGAWASWRRSWKMFDFSMKEWGKQEARTKIARNFNNKDYFNYYEKVFNEQYKTQRTDVWDYQWFFARNLHNTKSIVSTVNQISNIGFGVESTHTPNENDRQANLPIFDCRFPLKRKCSKIDHLYNWVMFHRFFNPKKKTILKKIILKTIELAAKLN